MAPPNFVTSSFFVAAGGALGSWSRYLVGRAWTSALGPVAASAFPWATLTVNIVGSFAMGLLVGWLARLGAHGEGWRLLIGVGLIGGFTTFSSFSMEFALLVERGTIGTAVAYVAISLIAGIGAMFAGLAVMRGFA